MTTINSSDAVNLSFYWYKASVAINATTNDAIFRIIKPAGDSVDIWTNTTIPSVGTPEFGNYNQDVSSFFDQNGTYTIRLFGGLGNGKDAAATSQVNFDDIILDVVAGANSAPAVSVAR